ncbi:SMI1/KNR4 family protein [Streptomyces sp. NPDC057287]|uniref:SMI1/KNR4 family protein n=1 Tax=Streptomyces sp. NPDC057287 TaxID=3346086 RepID=UPI00363F49D1
MTASSILAPAPPAAITAAEERMGVDFPVELRTWLQASGADDAPEGVAEGVVPGNRDLLGLAAMERTYHFKIGNRTCSGRQADLGLMIGVRTWAHGAGRHHGPSAASPVPGAVEDCTPPDLAP